MEFSKILSVNQIHPLSIGRHLEGPWDQEYTFLVTWHAVGPEIYTPKVHLYVMPHKWFLYGINMGPFRLCTHKGNGPISGEVHKR
jgi:hypothetical protein